MVNLNMTDSRDPDVIATNTSGIRLGVFCYPASASDVYEKLNADQLRTTAESIANNRSDRRRLYTTIETAAKRKNCLLCIIYLLSTQLVGCVVQW